MLSNYNFPTTVDGLYPQDAAGFLRPASDRNLNIVYLLTPGTYLIKGFTDSIVTIKIELFVVPPSEIEPVNFS